MTPKEEHISEEAKQRAKNYMSLKRALEPKQIKCYCGHTTYCDCSPLEEPKQETHICKWCKAETWQSDDECYAKPFVKPYDFSEQYYNETFNQNPTSK